MLDDIIKNNIQSFSAEELPEGHVERFENRLSFHRHKAEQNRLVKLYTIAASIALFLAGVGIMTFYTMINNTSNLVFAGMSPELHETELFYRMEISTKLETLKDQNKINKEILSDLKELDRSFKSFTEELEKNPGDDRIISAAISTYQMKLDILDGILNKSD